MAITRKKSELRKIFSFSNEETMEIFSNYIKDIALTHGCSESAAIEKLLAKSILPEHRTAAYYIRELFLNAEAPLALANAFRRFFMYLAAGDEAWSAKYHNGRPMVELFREILFESCGPISGDEGEWGFLSQQWRSIVGLVERGAEKDLSESAAYRRQNSISFGQELQRQIDSSPTDSALLCDCVNYLLEHWGDVGNHTRTYRALVAIAPLAKPKNTANNRLRYASVLAAVSAEWPQEGSWPV